MTDPTCPSCNTPWASHLDREALCRESRLAADARDAALAYAVQLQQIIEAMCRGGTIPHQYLAHGQMAAEAMKTRAQEAVRLREIVTRAIAECERQENAGDRDYGDSHDPQAIRGILEEARGTT